MLQCMMCVPHCTHEHVIMFPPYVSASGVLVATQVRGFLIQMLKLFHAWSSTLTSNTVILLLAEKIYPMTLKNLPFSC